MGLEGKETVDAVRDTSHGRGEMQVSRPTEDTLLVRLSGTWTLRSDRPRVAELQRQLDAEPGVQHLIFDTQGLTAWDSGLLTFIRNMEELCRSHQIAIDHSNLPDGIRRLLDLAAAWTLDQDGTVYAVSRSEVPEGADVAAILRY